MKHLGHIPVENLSSDWSVFLITNAMKEHCVTEFQTDVKPEKGRSSEEGNKFGEQRCDPCG